MFLFTITSRSFLYLFSFNSYSIFPKIVLNLVVIEITEFKRRGLLIIRYLRRSDSLGFFSWRCGEAANQVGGRIGVHLNSAHQLFDRMSSPLEMFEEDVLIVMREEKITGVKALHLLQEELKDA